MAKCQKCNGDGKERNYFGVFIGICPRCYGTGEAQPITNKEFLRSATTEQLAEFLVEHAEELTAPDGDYHKHVERFVIGWLQKEHEE